MTTVIFLQNLEEYLQNNINRDLQALGYKILVISYFRYLNLRPGNQPKLETFMWSIVNL